MKVVFLGSSDYSVTVLQALIDSDVFDVVGVVTQPDARSGRGQKVTPSAISQCATDAGLTVHQPVDVNEPEFLDTVRGLAPDLLLTASYGQKLSDELLGIAGRYALNLHASLLPRHRGASPVHAALLEGDETTGVSLMGMTSRMDAGPVYATKETPIAGDDTSGSLLEKLGSVAAELITECGPKLEAGELDGVEQDESQATRAPMLKKEDGRIRWDRTAQEIDRHVRAMSPWPSAFTFCPTERSPQRVQVVSGEVLDLPSPGMPGTVVAFTSGIEVATAKGVYRLLQVKRSGKRALDAVEFLRGFPIPVGTRLQ